MATFSPAQLMSLGMTTKWTSKKLSIFPYSLGGSTSVLPLFIYVRYNGKAHHVNLGYT